MKKSKGFSPKIITDLAVQHVEKLVTGLVVLVLLFLVYNAMTREQITFSPEDLTSTASSAGSHIDTVNTPADAVLTEEDKKAEKEWEDKWDHVDDKIEIVDWVPIETNDSTVRVNLAPRTRPAVLPILGLRGTPGIGAVSMRQERGAASASMDMYESEYGYGGYDSAGAGGKLAGKRWIVLTGLIPYLEQTQIFNDIFLNSSGNDLKRDRPIYINMVVERAEVDPKNPGAAPKWTNLNASTAAYNEGSEWASMGGTVIDRSYMVMEPLSMIVKKWELDTPDPVMAVTMPNPPVVRKQFGAEVAYPPAIPLLSAAALERYIEMQAEREKAESERRPGQLWNRGASGGMGGYGDEYGAGEYGGSYGSSYGGEYGDEYGYGSRMMEERKPIEHKLFRYYDFSVEPGKSYIYRAKLVLANPNYGVDERHLAEAAEGKIKTLATEFCDASSPVGIPTDSRVLTVSVETPQAATAEPNAEVCIVNFDMKEATETSTIVADLQRGQVANFFGQAVTRPRSSMSASSGYGSSGPRGSGRRPTRPQQAETADFLTDVCVLDMLGGRVLPSKTAEKNRSLGKLLLLDPSGQITVRTEEDDQEELANYKKPERSASSGYPGYSDEESGYEYDY